jgi:hypothetical protein
VTAVADPASGGTTVTELTLAELRLQHARLTATAARLRLRSRTGDPTSRRTLDLCRDARFTQQRADDYAAVLRMIGQPTLEAMETDLRTGLIRVWKRAGFEDDEGGGVAPLEEAKHVVKSLFLSWKARSHDQS